MQQNSELGIKNLIISLVRLMGRHAGFIALEASVAAGDVDICLIPEFKFEIHGPKGVILLIIYLVAKICCR